MSRVGRISSDLIRTHLDSALELVTCINPLQFCPLTCFTYLQPSPPAFSPLTNSSACLNLIMQASFLALCQRLTLLLPLNQLSVFCILVHLVDYTMHNYLFSLYAMKWFGKGNRTLTMPLSMP